MIRYFILFLLTLSSIYGLAQGQEPMFEDSNISKPIKNIKPTRFQKDSLYGVKNDKQIIIPAIYQELRYITKHIIAKKNNKFGIINLNNEIIIPFIYKSIKQLYYSKGDRRFKYYIVRQGDLFSLIDSSNNVLYKEQSRIRISGRSDNLILTNKDGYVGAFNFKGDTILSQQYSNIVESHLKPDSSQFIVVTAGNQGLKVGVYSIIGEEVLEPIYDEVGHWENGFLIKEDGIYYALNSKTKERNKIGNYDLCQSFYNDNFLIKKKNKQGILNSDFQTIIPCEYTNILFSDSLYHLIDINNKKHLFSTKGENMLPFEYISYRYFKRDDIILVKTNESTSILYDKKFNILKEQYQSFFNISYNDILGESNGIYKFISCINKNINTHNDRIYNKKISQITKISDQIYLLKTIDNFSYLYPPIRNFELVDLTIAKKLSNNLISAQQSSNYKYGVFDYFRYGKISIPFIYDRIEIVSIEDDNQLDSDYIIKAIKNGHSTYYNKSGVIKNYR